VGLPRAFHVHVRARMRDDHTRDLRAVGLALPATPLPGPEHNQDERKDKQRKLDYSRMVKNLKRIEKAWFPVS
jgi:hypothetical protein